MLYKYSMFISLALLFFFSPMIGSSQDSQSDVREYSNKFELGIGFGEDHAWLGIKGKYNLTNSVGIYASLGAEQINLVPPSVGIQYNLFQRDSSKWSGYVLCQVGMLRLKLNHLADVNDESSLIELTERQFNVEIGGGVTYRVSPRFGLNFGIMFLPLNRSLSEDFSERYNLMYETNFEADGRVFLPTIAINYYY